MDAIRGEDARSGLHMKSIMSMRQAPQTYLCYGVLVSLEVLGARLEAHVACRDLLADFERWTEHLPRLPHEVRQMIVEEVQQSAYEEYLEWWKAANKCCKMICDDEYGHEDDGDPSKMMTKFIIFRKVFEEDFGLEIRFMLHRVFTPEMDRHPAILLAYIALPPVTDPGILESGDEDRKYPAFSICSWAVIDHIPEPTPKQKELFQVALKTLHLQPMDHNIAEDPVFEEDFTVPASPYTHFPKLLVLTSGIVGG